MRVRWCLVFLLGRVVLEVLALTVLGGNGQFLGFCLGVLFVVFALFRRAGRQDYDPRTAVPPGAPGPTS